MTDKATSATTAEGRHFERRVRRSEFEDWFVAQHGTRHEAGKWDSRTDQELRDAIAAGEVARHVLLLRECYDYRRQSALYAWAARDPAPNAKLSGPNGPAEARKHKHAK